MTIRFLFLGKNKPSYIEEGVQDFSKRMQPYADIEILYLKDLRVHDDVEKVLKEEAEIIEKHLHPQDYVIVCDEKGKIFDSISFASHMEGIRDQGNSSFVVIVGSSHGLAQNIKERADFLLSLSPLTMNHQVVRLILLEQFYRMFTLWRGMKYHK